VQCGQKNAVSHPEMLLAVLGLISQHNFSSIQILCHSHYPLQLLGLGFSNWKKTGGSFS
jgi:hypothetical protein